MGGSNPFGEVFFNKTSRSKDSQVVKGGSFVSMMRTTKEDLVVLIEELDRRGEAKFVSIVKGLVILLDRLILKYQGEEDE